MLKDWARSTLNASGNFGKNSLWNTTEVLLLFLLTDILGMAPAVAGFVIFFSLLIAAILDPIVGLLAERIRTPLGQFGPLLVVGAPLAALSFIGLMAGRRRPDALSVGRKP
jgi:GPH family glycoside/pentoside/hexuronide:cation symporter